MIDDNLIEKAIQIAKENRDSFGVSLLQRNFKIGNVACMKLMFILEEKGIVSPYDDVIMKRIVLV